jgi:hypothetical protein
MTLTIKSSSSTCSTDSSSYSKPIKKKIKASASICPIPIDKRPRFWVSRHVSKLPPANIQKRQDKSALKTRILNASKLAKKETTLPKRPPFRVSPKIDYSLTRFPIETNIMAVDQKKCTLALSKTPTPTKPSNLFTSSLEKVPSFQKLAYCSNSEEFSYENIRYIHVHIISLMSSLGYACDELGICGGIASIGASASLIGRLPEVISIFSALGILFENYSIEEIYQNIKKNETDKDVQSLLALFDAINLYQNSSLEDVRYPQVAKACKALDKLYLEYPTNEIVKKLLGNDSGELGIALEEIFDSILEFQNSEPDLSKILSFSPMAYHISNISGQFLEQVDLQGLLERAQVTGDSNFSDFLSAIISYNEISKKVFPSSITRCDTFHKVAHSLILPSNIKNKELVEFNISARTHHRASMELLIEKLDDTIKIPFALTWGSNQHAVTIGYDKSTHAWFLLEANFLPLQQFTELRDAVDSLFECISDVIPPSEKTDHSSLEFTGQILFLFEKGCKTTSLDFTDLEGNTLFHQAVLEENLDSLKDLISLGANPNIVNKEGDTPLDIAIKFRPRIIRPLLNLGIKPESDFSQNHINRLLYFSVYDRNLEEVKYFHSLGGDLSLKNEEGDSLLRMATSNGDIEIMEYLLDHGEKPHDIDIEGN